MVGVERVQLQKSHWNAHWLRGRSSLGVLGITTLTVSVLVSTGVKLFGIVTVIFLAHVGITTTRRGWLSLQYPLQADLDACVLSCPSDDYLIAPRRSAAANHVTYTRVGSRRRLAGCGGSYHVGQQLSARHAPHAAVIRHLNCGDSGGEAPRLPW